MDIIKFIILYGLAGFGLFALSAILATGFNF